MEMTLSRAGDYVVRAAVYLAAREGEPGLATLDELSARMGIPRSSVPRTMGTLVAAGLAESRAGRGGGYRLGRPAAGVSLLEVVEVGEGGLLVSRCPIRGVPCHWGTHCALHPTMSGATEAVRDRLAATTLADVASEERRLLAGEVETEGSRAQRGR